MALVAISQSNGSSTWNTAVVHVSGGADAMETITVSHHKTTARLIASNRLAFVIIISMTFSIRLFISTD